MTDDLGITHATYRHADVRTYIGTWSMEESADHSNIHCGVEVGERLPTKGPNLRGDPEERTSVCADPLHSRQR